MQAVRTVRGIGADIEVADETGAAVAEFPSQLAAAEGMIAWQINLHPLDFVQEQAGTQRIAVFVKARTIPNGRSEVPSTRKKPLARLTPIAISATRTVPVGARPGDAAHPAKIDAPPGTLFNRRLHRVYFGSGSLKNTALSTRSGSEGVPVENRS